MPELDLFDDGGQDTVFRDVIFLALAGSAVMDGSLSASPQYQPLRC